MIQHKDLAEIYTEEDGFYKNFKFIGSDGKKYKFDSDNFNYLIKEYGEEPVRDCISLINGSIERMIEHKIAILIK